LECDYGSAENCLNAGRVGFSGGLLQRDEMPPSVWTGAMANDEVVNGLKGGMGLPATSLGQKGANKQSVGSPSASPGLGNG
jgi:hypothetical protein